MDIILTLVRWQHALVYNNVVFVFPKTPEEFPKHVGTLLQLINKAGMIPRLHNCLLFLSDVIDCLEHVIAPRRLHIATKTVDAVRNLKYPMTTSELRLLLELCCIYCRFVSNFSRMAARINERLKKGVPNTFNLNDEKQQMVDNMKEN